MFELRRIHYDTQEVRMKQHCTRYSKQAGSRLLPHYKNLFRKTSRYRRIICPNPNCFDTARIAVADKYGIPVSLMPQYIIMTCPQSSQVTLSQKMYKDGRYQRDAPGSKFSHSDDNFDRCEGDLSCRYR